MTVHNRPQGGILLNSEKLFYDYVYKFAINTSNNINETDLLIVVAFYFVFMQKYIL